MSPRMKHSDTIQSRDIMTIQLQNIQEDGKPMSQYHENSGGQECPPLSKVMQTDAPHVRPRKSNQEIKYPQYLIKYPQTFGESSPWISSQIFQCHEDSTPYLWSQTTSAKPPQSPLVTRQSQPKKHPSYTWKMSGGELDFHAKSSLIEDHSLRQKSCKKFGKNWESSQQCSQHSTHRPTAKQNKLIKNWNSTSKYSAISNRTIGENCYPLWNLHTMPVNIVPQGNHCSSSGMGSSQSSFPQ